MPHTWAPPGPPQPAVGAAGLSLQECRACPWEMQTRPWRVGPVPSTLHPRPTAGPSAQALHLPAWGSAPLPSLYLEPLCRAWACPATTALLEGLPGQQHLPGPHALSLPLARRRTSAGSRVCDVTVSERSTPRMSTGSQAGRSRGSTPRMAGWGSSQGPRSGSITRHANSPTDARKMCKIFSG